MLESNQDIILEMKSIVKYYGSLLANDNVCLKLHKGEILAVIGENGAGKSTLMKILYGLENLDSGEIFIRGKKVNITNASHSISLGIGMVQQHFMLFDDFTVSENVVYSREPKKNLFFDSKRAKEITEEISLKYDFPINPLDKISGMSVGLRQRVEILKILYQNTDIIIFDEPTAVLTPQEITEFLKTLKTLSSMGKSIIIITHKLKEVTEVCDRAIVMREGKFIDDINIKNSKKDYNALINELSFLMVGRKLIDKSIDTIDSKENILKVRNISVVVEHGVYALNDVTLHINGGEIVGIAGVANNGQDYLANSLFGLTKVSDGNIEILGKDITNKSVAYIRRSGVAMIPEDRYIWGSAPDAMMSETAIMSHYNKKEFSKFGILKIKNIYSFVLNLVSSFNIKTDNILCKTKSLSGGNAQKLIAAREISQNTPLLIACEPTRGVDIGAMEFIHDKLVSKRNNNYSVLLISSDLSEIMKLSDRIYVMYKGSIKGEFRRDNVTEEALGILMMGGETQNA